MFGPTLRIMANVRVPPFTEAPSTVVGSTPQTEFGFDFPFWESDDIEVYVDGELLDSADYTVEGLAEQDGVAVEGGYGSGTVTLDTAVSNVTVTIDRLVVGDRETQFSTSSPLGMRALNSDLNRVTARQQDLARKKLDLPAGERANKYVVFDSDGNPSLSAGTGADAGLRADLAATGGDALVSFLQAGTGAASRSVRAKLRDVVSVKDFGATGDGSTNDSAAINAALASGAKAVFFPAGTYKAALLTSAQDKLTLYGEGEVIIQKNASGDLLTLTGDDVTLRGIRFVGDASSPTFTGHGVVASGNNFTMLDCAANWFSGRAVKSTGNRTQIIGTKAGGVYQTTDTTASGYDIELGVSGTCTLYHQLVGIQTSQSTGGILLTDTGSQTIIGGQFGKLTIAAGTSPSGVNAGMVVGARITGDVSIGLSNGTFSGNQFAAVDVVLEAGTSGTSIDQTNVFSAGSTVTNNGNGANLIVRDGGIGGQISQKFGEDGSLAIISYDPASGDQYVQNGYTRYKNGRGIILNDDTSVITSGTNMGITNNIGAVQYASVSQHQFIISGVEKFGIDTAGRPKFLGGTQTTVGAAGAASALPANPTGYIIVNVGGTEFVVPYYAKA